MISARREREPDASKTQVRRTREGSPRVTSRSRARSKFNRGPAMQAILMIILCNLT